MLQLIGKSAKNRPENEEQAAMSNISKHDAEEEGKTDHRQNRRVGFSKRWDTICVDNLLVDIRDLIRYEVSRRRQFSIADLYNLDVNLVKSTPFQIR